MLAPAVASALPAVWRGGLTRCLTQGNLLRAPPNTDRFSVAEPEKFCHARLGRGASAAPSHAKAAVRPCKLYHRFIAAIRKASMANFLFCFRKSIGKSRGLRATPGQFRCSQTRLFVAHVRLQRTRSRSEAKKE